jgi:spore maturation protein CgeB
MNKKDIIILSSFFDKNLVKNLYQSDLSLKNQNYLEQIKTIKNKNYFSRIDLDYFFLKEYLSFEIFVNADYALNKLFEEENIQFKNYEEGILKIIERFKPKIVILRDINCLSINKLIQLKNLNKLNFKTILLNGFPIREHKMYSKFDYAVFRNPWLKSKFTNICKNSELIYHCFNSEILKKISLNNFKERDKIIFFDGSSYSDGFYEHKKRYFYLYKLLQKNLIEANIYENNNYFHKLSYYIYNLSKKVNNSEKTIIFFLNLISKINKKIFNKYYKRFDLIVDSIDNFNSSDYQKFYRGPLSFNFRNKINKPNFGYDYYNSINNSKISLNIHTEAMGYTAGNIRLFEITGMKSCMITENFNNISDLFEPDKDIVTYINFEDLEEKIQFLKKNLSIAQDIAEKGFEKVQKNHTEKSRIQDYLKLIKKII